MFDRRYDCILDNGEALIRVQIKTLFKRGKKMIADFKTTSNRTHYSRDEADIMACYDRFRGDFYFLPSSVFEKKFCLSFTHTGKYAKYKNAWRIFRKKVIR